MRVFEKAARQAQLLLVESRTPRSAEASPAIDPAPEMLCFRGQAMALLRHYFLISSQPGRVPSLLGREFFRARVSHHSVPSCEEQIVLACDVDRCLGNLKPEHAEIATLVGLYDFSFDEIAEVLHCSRGAISQLFAEALDSLAAAFLQAKLLSPERPDRRQRQLDNQMVPSDIAVLGRKPPRSVKAAPGLRLVG